MSPPKEPRAAGITPEALYQRRRDFLKNSAAFAATAAGIGGGLIGLLPRGRAAKAAPAPVIAIPSARPVAGQAPGRFTLDEPKTPFDDITSYNNYYELGLQKNEPSERAGTLKPRPWTVAIEGAVKKEQ